MNNFANRAINCLGRVQGNLRYVHRGQLSASDLPLVFGADLTELRYYQAILYRNAMFDFEDNRRTRVLDPYANAKAIVSRSAHVREIERVLWAEAAETERALVNFMA